MTDNSLFRNKATLKNVVFLCVTALLLGILVFGYTREFPGLIMLILGCGLGAVLIYGQWSFFNFVNKQNRLSVFTSYHTWYDRFKDLFQRQLDLIEAFKPIRDQEADPSMRKSYDEFKLQVADLKTRYDAMKPPHYYENRSFSELKKAQAEIIEIAAKFSEFQAQQSLLVNDLIQDYLNTGEVVRKANANMTLLVYYLAVSVPILSDFTNIFNEFSKDLILEVINKFGDITHSSHQIADDIEASMNSLMDDTKKDSLAFIIKRAHNLVTDFENFYQSMGNLKNATDTFTEKSSEKLQNIQGIADSIEQIAETIKVLSLNVSIEAANAGNTGKGFQVLARDLREFTTKTMKFAHEVKSRVKDALQTTNTLRGDYLQNMEDVYKSMDEIKNSITSFEGIIRLSFEQIKVIIANIKKFSSHIDSGIKEVVGRLQYYDITSQEVEHLGIFIERVFIDLFNSRIGGLDVSEVLNDEEKSAVKKDVLKIVSEIITTSNERKILGKYEEIFGIKVQEDVEINNRAAEELKGDNNTIILF